MACRAAALKMATATALVLLVRLCVGTSPVTVCSAAVNSRATSLLWKSAFWVLIAPVLDAFLIAPVEDAAVVTHLGSGSDACHGRGTSKGVRNADFRSKEVAREFRMHSLLHQLRMHCLLHQLRMHSLLHQLSLRVACLWFFLPLRYKNFFIDTLSLSSSFVFHGRSAFPTCTWMFHVHACLSKWLSAF